MTFLLDVNLLIALIDPKHEHNRSALDWFVSAGVFGWATCPIVENGAARIVGQASYPNSPGSPAAVLRVLSELRAVGRFEFWPDDISLVKNPGIDNARLGVSGRLTDTYLLALAIAHGGRLATFDRRLSPVAVQGGEDALAIIE